MIMAPPDPLERWIDFAAAAATSETNNSRGKGIYEEQLLPTVIEYDPVAAQPLTSQIEREEGPKHTVEVVPWKAWCASKTALALGEYMAYQAAITMVLVRTTSRGLRRTNACRFVWTWRRGSVGSGPRRQ